MTKYDNVQSNIARESEFNCQLLNLVKIKYQFFGNQKNIYFIENNFNHKFSLIILF